MGATKARSERVRSEKATGGKARGRRGRFFLRSGRMVLASLSRLAVVLVRMDDGARELPAPLVPDLLVPLLVVSALLTSLSRLVVVLVRIDDGARELPALLVAGLLMPLLVLSALLDALESLASIWDLEYMAVRSPWYCRSFE